MKRRFEMTVMDRSGQWDPLARYADLARAASEQTFKAIQPLGNPCLTLVLVNDRQMRVLNRTWRGFDKPTNVLSFPQMVHPPMHGPWWLGDCVIAYNTVKREARAEGKAFACHFQHLVVHGALHLLGYDHEHPHDARVMQRLEVAILATLGIDNPYA